MDSERVLREERWKKFVLEQWIYDLYKKKKGYSSREPKKHGSKTLGRRVSLSFLD